MLDFGKVAGAIGDLDSRLEQIANQQKITNALLALQLRGERPSTPAEWAHLRGIVDAAFGDVPKPMFAPTGMDDIAPHTQFCIETAAMEDDPQGRKPIETLDGAYIHDKGSRCLCTCHIKVQR